MKSVHLSKVLLDINDISIIKAYANHLKNVVNPYLKHEKIKTTKILYQIARSFGYRNYEEIKKTCTNKILFTDVYLYLSKTVEGVLFELLDPEGLTNAKEKENISNLSKHASNTFVYKDISRFLIEQKKSFSQEDISTLLVPVSKNKYEVILFRSYVELVILLEKLHQFQFAMHCIEDERVANIKPSFIDPILPDNFPVYCYIDMLLPPGSIFLVNEDEKVIGFDYISDTKALPGISSKHILMQLAFNFPSSFNYVIKREKKNLICERISIGFEGEIQMTNDRKIIDRNDIEGKMVVAESMFANPITRKSIEVDLSYQEYCNNFISEFLTFNNTEEKNHEKKLLIY